MYIHGVTVHKDLPTWTAPDNCPPSVFRAALLCFSSIYDEPKDNGSVRSAFEQKFGDVIGPCKGSRMESAKIIRFQGPNIYTDQNIPDEDKDDFDLIR